MNEFEVSRNSVQNCSWCPVGTPRYGDLAVGATEIALGVVRINLLCGKDLLDSFAFRLWDAASKLPREFRSAAPSLADQSA